MSQQMIWFFVSIAFSLVAWGIVTARYIWPELRLRERAEALRPLLMLHSFRFIGLSFLVPGVVSSDLPPAFAHPAAYGDLIAAILALSSLRLLPSTAGVSAAWIFSVWGSADILNAFYQANHVGLLAGQLGAAFFLPTVIVPLLLITHGLAIRILLQHQPKLHCNKLGMWHRADGHCEGCLWRTATRWPPNWLCPQNSPTSSVTRKFAKLTGSR